MIVSFTLHQTITRALLALAAALACSADVITLGYSRTCRVENGMLVSSVSVRLLTIKRVTSRGCLPICSGWATRIMNSSGPTGSTWITSAMGSTVGVAVMLAAGRPVINAMAEITTISAARATNTIG